MPGMGDDTSFSLEQKRALLKQLLQEQAAPLRERDTFPLSFAQRRLWFLHRLYPHTTAYNVPWLKRLRGPLDRHALDRALTALLRRHEPLRTTFRDSPDGPVQVIHPAHEIRQETIPIPGDSSEEREEQLVRHCMEFFEKGFDLEKGPLFAVFLFQVAPDDHTLLFLMHHIVTDGWSLGVLTAELRAFYNAFHAGENPQLPPLPIQYADFALWQTDQWATPRMEAQRAYWRKQLAHLTPLTLRTDHPRPAHVTFNGDVTFVEVPETLYVQAQQIAVQEQVTLFVLFLAAFNALLHQYAGQEDIVVGTPIANRNRQELEGLIGFFVNTLVLRTDVSGRPTFRELLQRTRQVAFDAFDHQDLPFESIVEDLSPERDASRHPLFQVALAVQNTPAPRFLLDGLVVEDVPAAVPRSVRMDLELHLTETEYGQFICVANFNRDLFDTSTIERILRRYLVLLEGAFADINTPIGALPILLPGEQDALLDASRGPAVAFPMDRFIHEYIREHARIRPAAIAVVQGDRSWTYAQLDEYSDRLAARLLTAGFVPGQLAAVYLRRSPEMILAYVAVLKAGGGYVALDPETPPLRLADMLEDVQTSVVLLQDDLRPGFPEGAGVTLITVDPETLPPSSVSFPQVGLKDSAYVIFTSGSTGRPKGTLIHHDSLINMSCWLTGRFGLTPKDRVSSLFAPGFDGVAFEVWPCMMAGAALYLPDDATRIAPDRLRDWLVANAVTLSTVPTVIADALLALSWPKNTALRYLIAGGDRLHRRPTAETPFAMVNAYGPTENTVVATVYEVPPSETLDSPPIGKPITNVQTYILDAYLRPVPAGMAGELYLGGAQVAQGYIRRPEMTAARFIENPFDPGYMYKTGDLARFNFQGEIEFLGRMDSQVQLYGLRIELGEIEEVLCRYDAVAHAVVLMREDQPGQKRLVAYLTAKGPLEIPALNAFLRERLPGYMVPAACILLDALPMTPNGKVDHKALPAPSQACTQRTITPPRNPLEERLVVVWRRLLSLPEVGVEENFFELGGNSLLILQVVTQIREEFDVDPPLQNLFERPTIAAWAEVILELQSGLFQQAVQTPVIPLRRHGSRPPLFCVAAVGGTVLTYYALTHFLGEDQPVYGLQDPSYVSKTDPIATVDALADLYVSALREVQPEGPYRLFGWSFGAIVACEIARRLLAQGHTVDALFLLDPPPVSFMEGSRIERAGKGGLVVMFIRAVYMFFMHGLEGINLMRDGFYVQFATYWHKIHDPKGPPRSWWIKPFDAALYAVYRVFLKNSQLAGFLEDGSRYILIQQPNTAGFLRIFRANIRAIAAYRPEPCPVRGIIIFSEDERMSKEQQETEKLWRKMCAGGLDVERTSGNHLSTVRLPHVRTLAELMRKHLG